MTKKSFAVIFFLSIAIWYFSRIAQALVEMFILKIPSISLYPTSNSETGYPIAINLSQDNNSIYFYYFINIIFWFLVIWGVWKILSKLFNKR